jgi:hypothetical protein
MYGKTFSEAVWLGPAEGGQTAERIGASVAGTDDTVYYYTFPSLLYSCDHGFGAADTNQREDFLEELIGNRR